MNQPGLFGDTIYDALEQLVAALGGNKRVGYALWPDEGPERAGQRLRDCLNPKHRLVLKPEDVIALLRMGQQAGVHDAMWLIADQCDYTRPEPVNREQQVAELQKDFLRAVERLDDLTNALRAKGVRLEAVS